MKIWTTIASVGAGLVLVLSSLTASAEDQTIRLGSVLAATGPAAFLGAPEQKTLKYYVGQINDAGGIEGKKIDLIIYDSGGDANKARTFAQRLVEEDKVEAVIGGTTTGSTMAMIPVFENNEIPLISLAGGVAIIDPVKPYIFKTPHTDRMACEKIFTDMKKRGLTKIGMVSGTGGFGASMHKQCLAVAGKKGIGIVVDETYNPQDTDMTAQITKIRNTEGVEAVLNPGFGQGPAVFARNYAQLGMKLPLYESHGVASKQFIKLAGDAAEGIRLPAAALLVADQLPDDDPQKPVVVGYRDTYEKVTGEQVSTFGGHAYDALMILKDAIERADSTDPKAIRDAIEKTKGLIGTGGVFNMSPTDHLGLDESAFRMLQIKNGDWVLAK
jgi:branched-chain amino acid transport system substrate-binding protein